MSDAFQFEWDEAKRRVNIDKHAVDFWDAIAIFDGYRATWRSDRNGESRLCTVGLLRRFEVTVIYTMRDETIRIISARRASFDERTRYYTYLSERGA